MDLSSKIQAINKKVIRLEFDKALLQIKEISEEKQIKIVTKEAITQLTNLNQLEGLKRMNQMDESTYLTERSQVSSRILELKDKLVSYIENPETIPNVNLKEAEKEGKEAVKVDLDLLKTTKIDWFRKVLLALFAIFGGAALYFIFVGAVFQSATTSAMLVATYGAKIFDDNNKMKMKKLLIDHQLRLQQKA